MMNKYRDVIPYAVFGILTTLVNIGVYWLGAHVFGWSVMVSTVTAWFGSVLFAYLTNRKWVFHSDAHGVKALLKECLSFFAARLLSGGLDWVLMYVFVDLIGYNDVFVKVLSNIVVIVVNYAASKWIVFRHKR